ncbi:MAG: hypothetical protein IJK60_05660 [Clostridia bacterium]|nr:hypothetical protein [Clostridia bacterium]
MNILDYIPTGHANAISRRKLTELTGLNDRRNRNLIMKEKMQGALILNMEDGKGYFKPDLPAEIDLVRKAFDKESGRCYAASTVMERLAEALVTFE